MSKSVGNVIDPHLVINGGADLKQAPAYGADVIRVWAASTDYTKDVTIGPATLSAASTTLRKVWQDCMFRWMFSLMSNILSCSCATRRGLLSATCTISTRRFT